MSPNLLRSGILALVLGMLLCVGLAFALPSVAGSGIGRAARRATRIAVGRPASGARECPPKHPLRRVPRRNSCGERGRRIEPTVAGAALETSLTVKDANPMFSALVPQGHLKVSIERDRLLASYLVNRQRTACSEASRVVLKGGRLRGGSTT